MLGVFRQTLAYVGGWGPCVAMVVSVHVNIVCMLFVPVNALVCWHHHHVNIHLSSDDSWLSCTTQLYVTGSKYWLVAYTSTMCH